MAKLIYEVMPHGLMVRYQGEWRDATLAECAAYINDLQSRLGVAAFDRACILREVDDVAPDDAPRIRLDSYARLNPTAQIAGAGMGNN